MPSDYPNSGILFRSDHKRPGDARDRDYRGDGRIDCPHCGETIEIWLSGWVKQGKRGPFLALSLKPKDAPPQDRPAAPEPAPDDDIPF